MVEEVVEDERWGEVSEEEEGGGKDKGGSDCGSDDSSPPTVVEAVCVGPEEDAPADAVPLLYS